VIELPVPVTWVMGTGASHSAPATVQSAKRDMSPGWAMAGVEIAVETARRYIIKRPRLTRLLDGANARVLMLIGPAGFGKTTLAREWAAERPHVWYRGTTATADVAALAAGLAAVVSEVLPGAGSRMVQRMRATGTPEQDVDILAELFAEDLAEWPADTWLVVDDYQFAMEASAPERFVDLILRNAPVQLLLTSRKRPSWASARRLLYGEVYELGRNELAMDHEEAAAVLSHRKDAPAAGLVALAEGWPAVIGLAALTDDFELPEGGLPDSLYEYFAEELYQAAAPAVQRGLCRLALAPSLGEDVAKFLLGDDAPEVISEGVRLGFLTGRSETLDLHPLLRTFLDAKTRARTAETFEAARLAHHLAKLGSWDDAFALVEKFFSVSLFVEMLESGLRTMLAEARLATLARWLELAESRKVDAPIIDLAGAEIAFHEGKRRKSEALAIRATRRLCGDHPMLSRAFYIAGASARMDFHNERAKNHFELALDAARTVPDKRDALWGELTVLLDLDLPGVGDNLRRLVELDDGSADSEVRLAVAEFIIAIRHGASLRDISHTFDSTEHLLPRITEPQIVSSFHTIRAHLLALLGRYSDALSEAVRSERYARDVRLPFVIGYARRVRAMAELGLRHFSRCKQILDWLDREALDRGDIFLELEARLIRSRLFIAQGLATRGVEILHKPPERFPFEGERGEYLATLGLALVCAGNSALAVQLADEAQAISRTVEVRTLPPCVRAIAALQEKSPNASSLAREALQTVREVGDIDSFVAAYRGYPNLLVSLAQVPEFVDALSAIVESARDWSITKSDGLRCLGTRRRGNTPLSYREEEVLGLIALGLTNKEIAGTLFISEATAKVHVRHILEKLGVRTRTEAALRAAELSGEPMQPARPHSPNTDPERQG
jgi:DNA-binding CsgD family transcriptional regulator